jgi:hypothetical protein
MRFTRHLWVEGSRHALLPEIARRNCARIKKPPEGGFLR